MEEIIAHRVSPIMKCVVLFLLIFTAKVLTSRPHEAQESKNSIHHPKPVHFVRTFTKYHHRRPTQWHTSLQNVNSDWPLIQDSPKSVQKRSVEDVPNSNVNSDWPLIQDVSKPIQKRSVDNVPNSNVNSDWPLIQDSPKSVQKRSVEDVPNSNVNSDWPLIQDVSKPIQKRSVDDVPNSNVNSDWPLIQDNPKSILKRSVEDVPNSNEFIENTGHFASDTASNSIVGSIEKEPITKANMNKNGLTNEMKKYQIKSAIVVKDPPTTVGPTISCLYKIHSVALSVTPSYDDEINAQQMVENEHDAPGHITETVLESGERVQLEQCTEPRATCYTLWVRTDDGNMTVLGQGCWRSSKARCDKCTRVTPLLPGTRFCCCTTSFCNADFLSMREEVVTPRAELTIDTSHHNINYANIVVAAILALIAIVVLAVAFKKMFCTKPDVEKEDLSDGIRIEKGDIMGSGPDALATGLLCVDNLSLIEHIGSGKFGSVWRGSLGSHPVAVKLYSNASTWQKERDIYAMPHIAHANILRYYGSDTRPTLTSGGGGREHLIVLELCSTTLRRRLEEAPLSWTEFALLAHGLASALAHLHTSTSTKSCIVHRDVNSNNVLLSRSGHARLADLGLAQPVRRAHAPSVTEAGTLRYLAPEALEGALDLSGAGAALCAVDVYALGLVLWEMLWRTRGAHQGPVPPYSPPYQHAGLPSRPTLSQMQVLVSRKKARPPLPRGPAPESRAHRVAADTCDECWDHDAEARLTAVCVEERMCELMALLRATGPVIHDNNLHTHHPDASNPQPETDKNSNCIVSQSCDVTTPLLYTHPHIGRNPCLERNTHTNTQAHTVTLIHKSLKDITVAPNVEGPRVQNVDENCLSVARVTHNRVHVNENSDRMNEIRSYQRPLDYVPNDVSVSENRVPKQTNLLQDVKVEKPKWAIRKFFERKLLKVPKPLETQVSLVPENSSNSVDSGRIRTSIVNEKPSNLPLSRPSNIVLNQDGRNLYSYETPCLSPPNRTLSPTMIAESDMNRENKVFGFKELPAGEENDTKPPNQIFAVIVPKGKPVDYKRQTNLIEMRSQTQGSSESLNKTSIKTSMSSQSIFQNAGHSESEDSTIKKRLSCDNKIISNASNSGRSSRASINLELQYLDGTVEVFGNDSPFDLGSDCSSSEDEHLMLLSENGGSKITMQTVQKTHEPDKRKPNEVLKESSQTKTDFTFNKFQNKYTNLDNEFSDPNDKENLVNGYSGDNPVYLAALNGEIDTADLNKYLGNPIRTDDAGDKSPKSPKPSLMSLSIKRQHSLEQVSEIFSSSGDVHLQNPAGRVKTPGDLPVAIRKARRDRALQKGRANEANRLSLYDDRMMFGNSL